MADRYTFIGRPKYLIYAILYSTVSLLVDYYGSTQDGFQYCKNGIRGGSPLGSELQEKGEMTSYEGLLKVDIYNE